MDSKKGETTVPRAVREMVYRERGFTRERILQWMTDHAAEGLELCKDFYSLFGVPRSTIEPPWATGPDGPFDLDSGAASAIVEKAHPIDGPPVPRFTVAADRFDRLSEATGAAVATLTEGLRKSGDKLEKLDYVVAMRLLSNSVLFVIDDLVAARNAPTAKRLDAASIKVDPNRWTWRKIADYLDANGIPCDGLELDTEGTLCSRDGRAIKAVLFKDLGPWNTIQSPVTISTAADVVPPSKSVIPPADEKIGPFFTALYGTLAPGIHESVSETNGLVVDPPTVETDETEGDRMMRFFKGS